jgi:zinc transport system permease protein
MTTLNELLVLLQAGFVQRAFIIGVIVAILSSVLSVFIVLKRVSLIGDGLSHTAFGGLALGYYLDIVPLWVAAVVVVLGSLGITRAIRSTKISSDAAVAVFLQLGLSSGIVLISLARGFGINIESLLFGSILLVTLDQIIIASVILVAVLTIIFLFYKELVYTTFSEAQARASGVQTWFFDYLVAALAGVIVIAAIPIVGVLLISALLVLPALTSLQVSKSFKQAILLSPVFGIASAFLGLFMSLILDIASGATIVLTAMTIFVVVLGAKRIWTR